MGRDIHYCECGEEIFDDMEECSLCAIKTERRAGGDSLERVGTDWLGRLEAAHRCADEAAEMMAVIENCPNYLRTKQAANTLGEVFEAEREPPNEKLTDPTKLNRGN